ncbi:MAG: NAD(P)H-hydrate dehydratase [Thermodesulfobacteriota bacterium]
MLAVIGTVPDNNFPIKAGLIRREGEDLLIEGERVIINRGTPALIAAALEIDRIVSQRGIFGYLVGDAGVGEGSRKLYAHLQNHLGETNFSTIVFHYILPDIDGHNRVLITIQELEKKPILIADAGYMYAAKMSGQAPAYDLFTPDVGELAFLADDLAPHPFYTRGFILHEENRVPDLIARSYAHENAARYLLVKGKIDYLADKQGIIAKIEEPCVAAMEAIGGTGDTLTGIVTALVASGKKLVEAAILGARLNRLAGYLANPDPGTSVKEIIKYIPKAWEKVVKE